MALPIGLREIFAQLLFGHRLAVDLVRAVGKTQHPGARVGISEVKILADAAAAADLDGAAEGAAADGPLAHFLQRALGDADQPHAMMDAARAEPALSNLEATAFAQQDVRRRHPHILEHDLGVAVRRIVIAEDAERALDLDPWRIERHQHHGLAAVRLGLGIPPAPPEGDFAAAGPGAPGSPLSARCDVRGARAPTPRAE